MLKGLLLCVAALGVARAQAPPVRATAPLPLRIYSWREDTAQQLPGVRAMVWAHINYGDAPLPTGADYGTARNPATVASEVAAAFRSRATDDRVLFLWYAGVAHGNRDQPAVFPTDERNIAAYAKGGYTEFTRDWMTRFWATLAASAMRPSFIVLDYEDADGFWGLKLDYLRDSALPASVPAWAAGPTSALRKLQSTLGAPVLGVDADDYLRQGGQWNWNRDAIVAFNNWQLARRAQALRRAILDPATAVFHTQIPASNFAEQRRSWDGLDANGWSLQSRATVGNYSSPSTYLAIGGQRYAALAAQQPPSHLRALAWVNARNDVRSALSVDRLVAPWYSNPDFGLDPGEDVQMHRLRWAAGLLHDRAFGIATMLFWSERSWSEAEAGFAAPVLKHLRMMAVYPQTVTPRLPDTNPEHSLEPWLQLAQRITSERQRAP